MIDLVVQAMRELVLVVPVKREVLLTLPRSVVLSLF